jgi:hypothetical protein
MPNWQIHVDEDVVRRDGQYIDRTRRNTFTLLALAGKWKRIWPAAEIEVGHFLLLSPALMHTPALQWQWQESPTAALSRWHSGNKLCVAVSASTRARSSTFGTRQARAGAAASCVRGLTDDHTWRMICMACSMQMGTVNPQHRIASNIFFAVRGRTERPLSVPYDLSRHLEIFCKNIPDHQKLTMCTSIIQYLRPMTLISRLNGTH